MKQFRNMLYPYVVWLFIMVLVPMLMILLYAFTTAGNEVTTFRFTLDNFSRFLTDTVFLDVLKRSLLIAVVTTVVCVLLGYPIAYTIAKGPERSGRHSLSAELFIRLKFSAGRNICTSPLGVRYAFSPSKTSAP